MKDEVASYELKKEKYEISRECYEKHYELFLLKAKEFNKYNKDVQNVLNNAEIIDRDIRVILHDIDLLCDKEEPNLQLIPDFRDLFDVTFELLYRVCDWLFKASNPIMDHESKKQLQALVMPIICTTSAIATRIRLLLELD